MDNINQLKFSIIINVLENQINLKYCLDSIIAQPLSNFEIQCIVNNEYLDSLNILRNYDVEDNRISITTFEGDVTPSLNSVIADCDADYLFIIDSNCWFEYQFISNVLPILEVSTPDMLLFNVRTFKNNFPTAEYFHILTSDFSVSNFNIDDNKECLFNKLPFYQLKIYNSSFIKNNDIYFSSVNRLNGLEFNVKSLLLAKNMIYLDNIGLNWETDLNLISNKTKQNVIFNLLDDIKLFLEETNNFSIFKLEYYEFMFSIIENYLYFQDSFNNKELLLKKIKTYFKKNHISRFTLEKLSLDKYKFYIHVLNSNSFFEFNLLHNPSMFNKQYIENNFQNYGNLISEMIYGSEEIAMNILNDIDNNNFENLNAFLKITELNLFDEKFYREEYDYNFHINPILHYIYKGCKEGKKPNKEFDADFYSNFNENLKNLDMDPFIYFVTKGLHEGKIKFNKNAPQPYNFINKDKLSKKILKFHRWGINNEKRNKRIVVSLTSFPERMEDIHFGLYSLLNQSLKPDLVVLWLAKSQFPNFEKDLPQTVLSLKENGLTIKWCEDLHSYKKLLPSLESYPNDIIVTADDDIYYHNNPNQLVSLYSLILMVS